MTAYDKDCALQLDARRAGINLTTDDARTLRRAELTLNAWATDECNGTIQRDCDGDSRPYRYTQSDYSKYTLGLRLPVICPIPDRERGALERVKAVCAKYGAGYYHQGDPRGASLYIADHALDQTNYTGAVSCAVR
jgi:hypothetical protein